jgi:hypothetical protein
MSAVSQHNIRQQLYQQASGMSAIKNALLVAHHHPILIIIIAASQH